MKLCKTILRTLFFVLLTALGFGLLLAGSGSEPLREPLARLTLSTEYTDSATLEMEAHIENVRTPDAATKLVAGDSVCWQVFAPFSLCNTDYKIAGSNSAVTLAGQYLLIREFLDAHPAATDVYLVVGPYSIGTWFDALNTYNYAVVPFAKAGLLETLDDATRAELYAAYGRPFVSQAFASWVDRSPLGKKLYLNALTRHSIAWEGALSDGSARMLRQIDELCAQRGAAFHLLCPPLSDETTRQDSMADLADAMRAAGLYDRFGSYFTQAPYYPAELFPTDGIHLDYDAADIDFMTAVLEQMKQTTGLLDGFVTSYE